MIPQGVHSVPAASMHVLVITNELTSGWPHIAYIWMDVCPAGVQCWPLKHAVHIPTHIHILKSRNYRGDFLSEKKARHSADEKSLQSTSEMVTIVSFALFIDSATLVAQVVGNIG
jgi:hypothetical protein